MRRSTRIKEKLTKKSPPPAKTLIRSKKLTKAVKNLASFKTPTLSKNAKKLSKGPTYVDIHPPMMSPPKSKTTEPLKLDINANLISQNSTACSQKSEVENPFPKEQKQQKSKKSQAKTAQKTQAQKAKKSKNKKSETDLNESLSNLNLDTQNNTNLSIHSTPASQLQSGSKASNLDITNRNVSQLSDFLSENFSPIKKIVRPQRTTTRTKIYLESTQESEESESSEEESEDESQDDTELEDSSSDGEFYESTQYKRGKKSTKTTVASKRSAKNSKPAPKSTSKKLPAPKKTTKQSKKLLNLSESSEPETISDAESDSGASADSRFNSLLSDTPRHPSNPHTPVTHNFNKLMKKKVSKKEVAKKNSKKDPKKDSKKSTTSSKKSKAQPVSPYLVDPDPKSYCFAVLWSVYDIHLYHRGLPDDKKVEFMDVKDVEWRCHFYNEHECNIRAATIDDVQAEPEDIKILFDKKLMEVQRKNYWGKDLISHIKLTDLGLQTCLELLHKRPANMGPFEPFYPRYRSGAYAMIRFLGERFNSGPHKKNKCASMDMIRKQSGRFCKMPMLHSQRFCKANYMRSGRYAVKNLNEKIKADRDHPLREKIGWYDMGEIIERGFITSQGGSYSLTEKGIEIYENRIKHMTG